VQNEHHTHIYSVYKKYIIINLIFKINKDSYIPEKFELNEENGIFLGIYLAEGHSNNSHVTITNNNDNIRNFVKSWFEKHNISYQEKSKIKESRINGGFFILDSNIFKYIRNNDNIIFEKDVVKILVKKKEINAYLHNGFWQCMDTLREKVMLEDFWQSGKAPWKCWK